MFFNNCFDSFEGNIMRYLALILSSAALAGCSVAGLGALKQIAVRHIAKIMRPQLMLSNSLSLLLIKVTGSLLIKLVIRLDMLRSLVRRVTGHMPMGRLHNCEVCLIHILLADINTEISGLFSMTMTQRISVFRDALDIRAQEYSVQSLKALSALDLRRMK